MSKIDQHISFDVDIRETNVLIDWNNSCTYNDDRSYQLLCFSLEKMISFFFIYEEQNKTSLVR